MDHISFDRLTRLLGGAGSRRETLRALVVAALAGGAAEEILAADAKGKGKGRGKPDRKRGGVDRVAAERKGKGKGKSKGKKRGKKHAQGLPIGGGESCNGTPLQPGQDYLDCDLSGAGLIDVDLHSSSFKEVNLYLSSLCGADLHSTSFSECDLGLANLTNANLDASTHSKTSFAGANLEGASFRQATFSKCDLSGADLTRVSFLGATLDDVTLDGAIFCQTVLPDGAVDNSDCDACDNLCGCHGCDDDDCNPPTCCDGECVDTQIDAAHCGACNVACAVSLNPCVFIECVEGECVAVPRDDGAPCEDEEGTGVCCVAGSSSTCVIDAVCCSSDQCDTGETCCSGQCFDLETDFEHCGACDNACPIIRADSCVAGECTCAGGPVCPGPPTVPFTEQCQQGLCHCPFALVDCNRDGNCTECCTNAQCSGGTICVGGQCVTAEE